MLLQFQNLVNKKVTFLAKYKEKHQNGKMASQKRNLKLKPKTKPKKHFFATNKRLRDKKSLHPLKQVI
ncbi:hypothetical protein COU74_02810 [Candidatus Peregrinibacteria bacterium CG10_big_fil_rev_8_21_14_0_10_36_19]|nr:MAG: hypothetical protein COU74_02810 [Candidatus Peregrinibacteria bacterium CG10_big_fil_rev_8_21_14_0_10_36_19]